MNDERGDRVLSQELPPVWSAKEVLDLGMKVRRLVYLHGSLRLEEQANDGFKILHVRAENHGLGRKRGFRGILTAVGREALANKGNGGERVPVLEFAGGV
jgi:hypothetical protein